MPNRTLPHPPFFFFGVFFHFPLPFCLGSRDSRGVFAPHPEQNEGPCPCPPQTVQEKTWPARTSPKKLNERATTHGKDQVRHLAKICAESYDRIVNIKTRTALHSYHPPPGPVSEDSKTRVFSDEVRNGVHLNLQRFPFPSESFFQMKSTSKKTGFTSR